VNPLTILEIRWPAGHPERASHVLVVDHAVQQRNHPAEGGRQAARLQVSLQQGHQLVRGSPVVLGHAHPVDPVEHKPALREAPHQPTHTQLVIAENVGDHIAHLPGRAESGYCSGDNDFRNAARSARSSRA
jgi:hypothetical protein